MARYETEFTPDYAVAPGETLAETLEVLGMSPADLAQRSGLSAEQIDALLAGEGSLTPPIATSLEQALGIPAYFWLNYERTYREALVRLAAKEQPAAVTQ